MEATIFDTTSWDIAAHHPSGIALAFSPVGYDLAIGVETNESVVVRNTLNGQCRFVLSGHKGAVYNIVYSPDGTRIATSCSDTTARIWSSESGATVHILRGHSMRVWGAAFAPTGAQLATCSDDGTIRIWDTQTGESLSVLDVGVPIKCVAYSPDGYQIASGGDETILQLWNAHTGELTHSIPGHTQQVHSMMFSQDGRRLISSSYDLTVRVWDTTTGEAGFVLRGHNTKSRSITFSPTGDQIASSDTHTVLVWSAKTGERLFELYNSDGIGRFDYSSDDKYIITVTPSGHTCWDSQTGERVNRFTAIDTEFLTCTFSPNGKFLATAGRDGLLRVWDVSSEAEGGCKEVYQTRIELTLRIFWKEWKGDMYLVTMNSGLSRVLWKMVIASDPQNRSSSREGVVVGLKLASTRDGPGVLFLEGAKMDNVEGLDIPNLRLMKQRGASVSG
ncbi:MAG: WD40-repeat-containing domain protein [Linnemannia gamsii]|nr:MAG: WD40-repeat-containing domain protein [Linnemannia gamsii]